MDENTDMRGFLEIIFSNGVAAFRLIYEDMSAKEKWKMDYREQRIRAKLERGEKLPTIFLNPKSLCYNILLTDPRFRQRFNLLSSSEQSLDNADNHYKDTPH